MIVRLYTILTFIFLILLISLSKSALECDDGTKDCLFRNSAKSSRLKCFASTSDGALINHDDNDDEENLVNARPFTDANGNDLIRCPATQQADVLSDLNDFSTPPFIQNRTAERNETEQQPESAAGAPCDEAAATEAPPQTTISPTAEDEAPPTTREPPQIPPPPPIATFEEWTKEKLLSKEKKPPQIGVRELGAPAAVTTDPTNSSPPSSNSEASPPQASAAAQNAGAHNPNNGNGVVAAPPAAIPPSSPIVQLPPHETAKRNYASKECGAKVLLANEEAEHRGAVLSDKERDEYMRNPCEKAQHKFLIVELCETIQPNLFEFANYELFSSGPREIRLSVSERYPTAEWTTAGQFVAADTREMQSFEFAPAGVYAKFIRLDLLSHYGREHYCTLSTIRVSGISMVDEYEAEAAGSQMESTTSTVLIDPPQQQAAGKETIAETEPNSPDEQNETEGAHVLEKVATIVGTVLGKTFLGRPNNANNMYPKRLNANSCSAHSPLNNASSYIHCFVFDLLPPVGRRSDRKRKSLPPRKSQPTDTQRAFLRRIHKLSQCPTASAVPPANIQLPTPKPKAEEIKRKEEKPKEEPQPTPTPQPPIVEAITEPPKAAPPIATPPPQPVIPQIPKMPTTLPGSASTHKESVFMKLNKRLSALELNMSLSSEYLSELSRRYVAQQDGHSKQYERDVRSLEEMVNRLGDQLKAAWADELKGIRFEMSELQRQVRVVAAKRPHWGGVPYPFDTVYSSSLSVLRHQTAERCVPMLASVDGDTELMDEENDFSDQEAAWPVEKILLFLAANLLINVTIYVIYSLLKALFECFRRRRPPAPPIDPDEIRRLVREELQRQGRQSADIVDIPLSSCSSTTSSSRNSRVVETTESDDTDGRNSAGGAHSSTFQKPTPFQNGVPISSVKKTD